MKLRRAFLSACCLLAADRASAVYAPIPELEQGKALTVYLGSGAYYDTNIFGASTGAIDSLVFELSPKVAFNMSVTPQTFVSATYGLTLDDVLNRPGKKLLDSHEFAGRVAHTFSPETQFDLTDSFQLMKNPEALLPGVATVVNADQSYRRNQLDGRYAMGLTRRVGVIVKARATSFDYRNEVLGQDLNRNEYLFGLTGNRSMLPELKAMTEYRHQAIRYRTLSEIKDKDSDFLLAGFDYVVNARFATSTRLGFEHRRRRGAPDKTAPYAELGAKYDYGQGSFVSIGYGYSLQETSNVELYTDTSVHRFFVNVQQSITSTVLATMTASWEPGILHSRPGFGPDRNETNTLAGLALIYQPNRHWSATATLDYDHVHSEDPSRPLRRTRVGMNAKYAF